MKNQVLIRLSACVSIALLVACTSTPKPAEVEIAKITELSVLMDQAATVEKAGQKDGALLKYQEAAKFYPTSKLPWSKIAQIQFDSSNYGEAIVAAQQVVARDSRDKVAHSILSVSGLRVSTKALADLSRQNELSSSVRSEAQSLAKILRENLGESVLVPTQTVVDAPRTSSPSTSSGTSPAPRPVPTRPSRPVPAATAGSSSGSGNPFGALK
jgi:tetratricopeptide (TPR) repeat protein